MDRFSANSMTLKIHVEGEKPAWLLYRDSYHPDWKAWIDEKETVVRQAHIGFKAIQVPNGFHRIQFRYEHGLMGFLGKLVLGASVLVIGLLLATMIALLVKRPWATRTSPTTTVPTSSEGRTEAAQADRARRVPALLIYPLLLLPIPLLGWLMLNHYQPITLAKLRTNINLKVAYQLYEKKLYGGALIRARQLHEDGHPEGSNLLGLLHLHGQGTPVNPQRAVALLQVAVQRGSVNAMVTLGTLNFKGMAGLPVNHAQALKLFQKAAEKGNLEAQYLSGFILLSGDEHLRDVARGKAYFIQAAAKGHVRSRNALKVLEDNGL